MDLAMWVGKTLLALKTNLQEAHLHPAEMVSHVLSLLGEGVISATTRQTSNRAIRPGKLPPGNRTRRGEDLDGDNRQRGHYAEIKAIEVKSPIAVTSKTWRIFPSSADLKGSKEPTKEETTNTDIKSVQ